ncbi:MAG: hypothetical protein WBK26_12140 [Burkholderiaceae bacterium]
MKFTAPAVLLALAALATPAHAVFKCKGPTGTPVFQETPCAGEGQALQVKPASGAAPVPTKPAATATEGSAADSRPPETLAERINRNTETAAKERRVREVQGSFLPRAQAQLAAHRSACDSEYRSLQNKKNQSANNLAGATWEQSISSEMSALMSRCDSKARDYERNIDQLTRECTSLGGCKGM